MKLQNLTVIFIIIIIPIILLVSLYISTGLKTIKYQSLYDTGLLTATHDAIYAFEINTANNVYSDNAETKRNILKSSIKMFEKSLCNTCGISSYNTDEIEEYIPAIVFGMHDGFYMYAPSYLETTRKYEHNLKNYVYYSETLDDGTVIIYSLDNYITVSGYFNGKYETREGYLIDITNATSDGSVYKGIEINTNDDSAVKYYKEAYYFTDNLLKDSDWNLPDYLIPNDDNNDPEDENSLFVQHKKEVIKNKIESALNSSIIAYSERTWGYDYKMPKLSEEDWQKIYSNISMLTFFQGKSIGLTKYNGYCVLNSTNSNEYVNPNLMYFIDESDGLYHDIRCTQKEDGNLLGYRIGKFKKYTVESTDEDGNITQTYGYNNKELACYECINGSLDNSISIQEYINNSSDDIKTAYWTSIARERYNTEKILNTTCVITYELDGLTASNNIMVVPYGESYTTLITPVNSLTHRRPKEITVVMSGRIIKGGYTYNDVNGEIKIANVTGDVNIIASTERDTTNISFATAQKVEAGQTITANIDQSYRIRVFEFTPTETGTYRFWSEDKVANTRATDPYAYLYDGEEYSIEQLDSLTLKYISSKDAWSTFNYNSDIKPLNYDDDDNYYNWGRTDNPKAKGYNFSMDQQCEAGHKYYLVIRTYTADRIQNFSPIYIEKIN